MEASEPTPVYLLTATNASISRYCSQYRTLASPLIAAISSFPFRNAAANTAKVSEQVEERELQPHPSVQKQLAGARSTNRFPPEKQQQQQLPKNLYNQAHPSFPGSHSLYHPILSSSPAPHTRLFSFILLHILIYHHTGFHASSVPFSVRLPLPFHKAG